MVLRLKVCEGLLVACLRPIQGQGQFFLILDWLIRRHNGCHRVHCNTFERSLKSIDKWGTGGCVQHIITYTAN